MTGRAPESQGSVSTLRDMSVQELTEQYDLVTVNDVPGKEFAVVTPKKAGTALEIGSSRPSPWTSFTRDEYNPLLRGLRGLEQWDRMRKGDGTVRGTLRLIKTPVFAGRWFMSSKADDDLQAKQAEWVWKNLTEYMSISWTQVLVEALLMTDFGYYMFEKVWEKRVVDGELREVLTKLAPRHPMDVESWRTDINGGPVGVWMHCEVTDEYPEGKVFIPIEKLLVFTFDREAGNIEGISVLRSAYKHWYFKEQLYKIDAIQKERHGIGIPVIELPLGFGDDDKTAAENLASNIRTNERAHVVLPPSWKLYMLKLEGQPVDCLPSIEHHNEAIRENILVNFLGDAAMKDAVDIYLKASRVVADIFRDTVNLYLVPQMIGYNWPGTEHYPKLKYRRIGETADWRTLSFAIRNFIGAGVIIPDEVLEAHIREEMDLPPLDKDSARLIATPQNPYDINEDIDDIEDEDEDGAAGDKPGGGESTQDEPHNTKNPNYNRNRRKIVKRKQSGQTAGLPRQTPLSKGRGPSGSAGTDRSGG